MRLRFCVIGVVITFVLVVRSAESASTNAGKERSCVTSADCGSAQLFCEYYKAGCRGVTGKCRDTGCHSDPMSFTYCTCDGNTTETGSMCRPERAFASMGVCPRRP